MDREDRYYEILKTARLYYEDGKTQEQIARELEISRPTVANYLREARETGIVKIRIVDFRNSSRLLDLEQDLRAAFGLGFVKVIENSDLSDEYLCDRLGDEAARYFERLLRNGLRVGVSWGLTLKAMVGHLRQDRKVQDVEIVPLVGGAGKLDATMHANVLCEKIGAKYGATCHYLYAPAIAESPEMAASFRETIEVKEMLEKARRVDVALVGIGYPDKSSSMVLAGYFRKDDLRDLLKYHVVGDICTRFFDGMGAVPPIALNDRVIGIELGALREIDNVIGVAGGPQKVRAILGALRAGFLKSLITDSVTAAAILHEI